MFCKKCGKQIDDDTVYCPSCGTKQSGSISESIVETQQKTTIVQNQNSSTIQELTRQGDIAYLEQLYIAESVSSKLKSKIVELENKIEELNKEPLVNIRQLFQPPKMEVVKEPIDLDLFEIIKYGSLIVLAILSIFVYSFLMKSGFLGIPLIGFCLNIAFIVGIPIEAIWGFTVVSRELKRDYNDKERYKVEKLEAKHTYEINLEKTKKANLTIQKINKDATLKKQEIINNNKIEISKLKQEITDFQKKYINTNTVKSNLYSVDVIPSVYRKSEYIEYIYAFFSTSQETLRDVLMHLDFNIIQKQSNIMIGQNDVIIKQNSIMINQNNQITNKLENLEYCLSELSISSNKLIEQNNNNHNKLMNELNRTNETLKEIEKREDENYQTNKSIEFFAGSVFYSNLFK